MLKDPSKYHEPARAQASFATAGLKRKANRVENTLNALHENFVANDLRDPCSHPDGICSGLAENFSYLTEAQISLAQATSIILQQIKNNTWVTEASVKVDALLLEADIQLSEAAEPHAKSRKTYLSLH